MPSTDRLYLYLLYRGYKSQDIVEPGQMLNCLCESVGIEKINGGSKSLKKKILSKIRESIHSGNEVSAEHVKMSALIVMAEYEPYEPTDRAFALSRKFYSSQKWKNIRIKALTKFGSKCQCCGAMPDSTVLHVDHILPRSVYPELALNIENLQILCEECNMGKGNTIHASYKKRVRL